MVSDRCLASRRPAILMEANSSWAQLNVVDAVFGGGPTVFEAPVIFETPTGFEAPAIFEIPAGFEAPAIFFETPAGFKVLSLMYRARAAPVGWAGIVAVPALVLAKALQNC